MQSKVEFKNLLEQFSIWDLWEEKYKLTNMELFYGRQKRLYLPLDDLLKITSLHTVLKSILINDDWDTIDSIDISSLQVGNTYVRKCIADIAELKPREDYQHTELLIYYAIAIRFYIEKINKNVPIPSSKVRAEQAKADFQLLKAIDPRRLSLESDEGRKASNYFMEELRFSCKKQGKNLTFPQAWDSPALIGRIVSHLKNNMCINPSCFTRIRTDMTASQFRPATIKYLTHYINNLDHRVAITNYINLCGGWGDRLVGALGTKEIKRYIQTDPNEALFDATKELYNTYDPSHETEVHLYKKPLEDLTLEELCPNQQKNDLVAYSPPYFNKELYAGANQSHKRYPTIDSWVAGFLYKSVEVSYKALKVHGVLALNLANIQCANQNLYKLTDCLVHYLENDMSPFFSKFSEPLIYPTKNVPHVSQIFLYQAKEYKDAVPKLISLNMEQWTIVKGKKEKPENIKEKPSIQPIGVFPSAAIGDGPNSSRSSLPMFSLFSQTPTPVITPLQTKIMKGDAVYNLRLNELPLPEIVVGQVPSHSQSPLSILEIFKKRVDNWSPAEISPFGIKYQVSELFNQYLTVKDLKSNIHNFKDMADVLTHSKMSLDNRYLLLNALIVVFPQSADHNKIPEPYCDDHFIALLVKNDDDFKKLIHLITEYPHSYLVSKFLEWVTIKSLYLQNFISKYNSMTAVVPMMMQMNSIQSKRVYATPPVYTPMPYQNQQQKMQMPSNFKPELNAYLGRIAAMNKRDLLSFKVFEDELFDKEFTAVKLKENIHNLEDLLTIFREGNLPPKACYSLFNYLISMFPVPADNNGNLRAHPCDAPFLKKIITSEADIKTIYGFMSAYKGRNLVETLEKRLILTPHYRDLLRGNIIPQQAVNHSNCFFSSNTQPMSQLRPNTQKATVLIDLVSSEEENPLKKFEIKSLKDRRESEIKDSRPPKRLKENSEGIEVENVVAQRTALAQPLDEWSRFFAQEQPSIIVPQSPQGGEYEYEVDASGKKVPIF